MINNRLPLSVMGEPTSLRGEFVKRGYQEYKGLYYKLMDNNWRITDDPNEHGWLWIFNSDIYRLDQCFELVKLEIDGR